MNVILAGNSVYEVQNGISTEIPNELALARYGFGFALTKAMPQTYITPAFIAQVMSEPSEPQTPEQKAASEAYWARQDMLRRDEDNQAITARLYRQSERFRGGGE